ncbi:MAG: hypothetical protein H7239_05840 [Flavobacterium sp.]|nr:hypothetical protein [Flavobacterium sp.]
MLLHFNLLSQSEFGGYLTPFLSSSFGEIYVHATEIFILKYWFILSILLIIIVFISAISVKTRNKFLFANEIVNKGNILTIATNKKGELSFCSDQITELLGYTKEEVMGLGFGN